MAKVISPFKLTGSMGGLVYYENEFGPQVREKGGPSEWQVKNLERFANTRRNAAEWKRATAASKLMRGAMGGLLKSVKNIRLSGNMNGVLLAALKADPIHDKGERVVASGDLSLFRGFEFNPKLSLNDALPVNIENCFSPEAGKLAVDIPAFRLRQKKGLPKDATHYQLVSCILTIDFDKGTFKRDIRNSELQAMGRKAGAAFCIEQTVQPPDEQGCFWLLGIEFYKMVNELPVLVRGGALRVMEWIGKAGVEEHTILSLESEQEYIKQHDQMIGLIQGDITKMETDAIVNAANTSLLGGGGVDGAIHRAGGPQILEECQKIRSKQGGCNVGEAVITTGGNLPAQFVIHTVGPVWNNGQNNEEALLASAYRNSLQLAIDNGIKTIAFPNISTGIYRFPKMKAAQIAIKTVKDFLAQHHKPEKVVFVCYDGENYELYDRLLKE